MWCRLYARVQAPEHDVFVDDSAGLQLQARGQFPLPSQLRLQAPDTRYDRLSVGQHALSLAGQPSLAEQSLRQSLGHAAAAPTAMRCVVNCSSRGNAAVTQPLQGPEVHVALICRVHDGAQRPTVGLGVTAGDVLPPPATARPDGEPHACDAAAAEADAQMLKKLQDRALSEQPLALLVAHGPQHPKTRFHFHSRACASAAGKKRALVVSHHCDGAKFCEDLFGHFLLPNGRLAHFYYRVRCRPPHRDAATRVRQGYARSARVSLRVANLVSMPLQWQTNV